jgi:hypothetical protein
MQINLNRLQIKQLDDESRPSLFSKRDINPWYSGSIMQRLYIGRLPIADKPCRFYVEIDK